MVEAAGYHGPQEVEIFSSQNWWKRDADEVLRMMNDMNAISNRLESVRHRLANRHPVTGLPTRDLLEACQPHDTARFVVLHSYDGYTTNLPLEDFAAEDALLAHSWSDEPLTAEHGGPVRLVVPHLYFWKSAKWLQAIEFLDNDAPGYWEVRGYHNRGDPWAEQRYSGD